MSEMKEDMEDDWAQTGDLQFGEINPLEAMTKLDFILTNFGGQALSQTPEANKITKAVARMTETELRNWISLQAKSKSLEEYKHLEEKARDYIKRARQGIGLNEKSELIN